MKCPVCVSEGRTSKLYSEGGTRTLMGWSSYHDEEGVYHSHDPNRVQWGYRCSNGHVLVQTGHHKCPAGDYGDMSELTEFKRL